MRAFVEVLSSGRTHASIDIDGDLFSPTIHESTWLPSESIVETFGFLHLTFQKPLTAQRTDAWIGQDADASPCAVRSRLRIAGACKRSGAMVSSNAPFHDFPP